MRKLTQGTIGSAQRNKYDQRTASIKEKGHKPMTERTGLAMKIKPNHPISPVAFQL